MGWGVPSRASKGQQLGGRDKSGCLAAREPVVEPDHAPKGGTKHVRGHGLYPNVKLKPVQELKQEGIMVLLYLARNCWRKQRRPFGDSKVVEVGWFRNLIMIQNLTQDTLEVVWTRAVTAQNRLSGLGNRWTRSWCDAGMDWSIHASNVHSRMHGRASTKSSGSRKAN